MQIQYNARYVLFFCVVLLLCVVRSAVIDVYMCDPNNHTSAEFQSNMNIVLNTLVNNTSVSNGFNTSAFGQSPDRAYGLLQCWRDATVEECLSCSQEANSRVRRLCGNALGGRTWRDKCFIHYENYSFFGILNTQTRIGYNLGKVTDDPYVFRTAVKEPFTNLSDAALQSPFRYSSGATTTSTFYRIYSLVLCWSDLISVGDCKTCLTNAISQLLSVTFRGNETFQGGGAGSGSCYARYETYPFFNPAPPPLSPTPI